MFCKNCGSPVPEGAASCPFCGVGVPAPEARGRRIYVRPDFCCLCGKPLTEGHAVLFTYQSGDEARVDRNCCNMLSALYNKADPEKMKLAAEAIRSRVPDLDPAVADHLQTSLRQAEAFLGGKTPEQQRFTREVTDDSARKDAALRESRRRRQRRGLKIALILTLVTLAVTAAVLMVTGVIPVFAPEAAVEELAQESRETAEAVSDWTPIPAEADHSGTPIPAEADPGGTLFPTDVINGEPIY